MQFLLSIWDAVLNFTAVGILSLGFFSYPVPVSQAPADILLRKSTREVVSTTSVPIAKPQVSLEDSRAVLGKVNETGFYIGPEHCRTAVDEIVTLDPSGEDKLYTKEDAIIIAKQHCFFDGSREGDIPFRVTLRAASSTDSGMAWSFVESDHHPATPKECPEIQSLTPVKVWRFELNQKTGRLVVIQSCGGVIFD